MFHFLIVLQESDDSTIIQLRHALKHNPPVFEDDNSKIDQALATGQFVTLMTDLGMLRQTVCHGRLIPFADGTVLDRAHLHLVLRSSFNKTRGSQLNAMIVSHGGLFTYLREHYRRYYLNYTERMTCDTKSRWNELSFVQVSVNMFAHKLLIFNFF